MGDAALATPRPRTMNPGHAATHGLYPLTPQKSKSKKKNAVLPLLLFLRARARYVGLLPAARHAARTAARGPASGRRPVAATRGPQTGAATAIKTHCATNDCGNERERGVKEGRAKRGRRIKKTKNGQVPKKKIKSARTAANKPKTKKAAAATPVKPRSIHVESSVKHVLARRRIQRLQASRRSNTRRNRNPKDLATDPPLVENNWCLNNEIAWANNRAAARVLRHRAT